MGLFNVIKIDKKCPKCGAGVEWQSKRLVVDGLYPVHNFLAIFELDKRISGEAHAQCNACHTSSEVFIKDGEVIDNGKAVERIDRSIKKYLNWQDRKRVW